MAWITADEALALLHVQPQTLYANVSRGRIRARPDPGDPRRSRYLRSDVEQMASRRSGRRPSGAVAAAAIEWGEPVLPSAISTVVKGRLVYRGQDAVLLAEQASLETVADLLWEGPTVLLRQDATPSPPRGSDPIAAAALALAARLPAALPSLGRNAAVLREDAACVFATVAQALLGPRHAGAALHERIARAWKRPQAQELIRCALVLLADHELNASTFAARVAVSTGASLAAGVLAGLATLSGPRHGRASAAVEVLVEQARLHGAQAAVRNALAGGGRLDAFGHPLYPDGDVRAAALLARLELPPLHAELGRWGVELLGEQPNVDFALSAMASACDLPPHAPLTLFALARCVGWLAHGLEQAQGGQLIRPRARYTGLAPAWEAGTTR